MFKKKFLNNNQGIQNKSIALFLILTVIFTQFLVLFSIIINNDILYDYFGYIIMICPGAAGLIVSFAYYRGQNLLGISFCSAKYILLAILIPIATMSFSYIIYWVFITDINIENLNSTNISLNLILINIFFAFAEELGWRGFLAPAFTKKYGFFKGSIYVGIIWSLWHFTLGNAFIYEEYYYSGATIIFVLTLISFSFIMNYLQLKSKSILPAVLIHAVHNYLVNVFDSVTFGNLKPYLVGEVGVITFVIGALFSIIIILKVKKSANFQEIPSEDSLR